MTNELHDTGPSKMEEVAQDLQKLAEDPGITVGVHAEDNARQSETGGASSVNLAYLLAIHVFGKGVPQRDPLRPVIDENQRKYARMLEEGIRRVLDGQITIDRMLRLIGQEVVGDVQGRFGDKSKLLENADSTIRQKSTSAGEGDAPLIDTGQLKQAIDFQTNRED